MGGPAAAATGAATTGIRTEHDLGPIALLAGVLAFRSEHHLGDPELPVCLPADRPRLGLDRRCIGDRRDCDRARDSPVRTWIMVVTVVLVTVGLGICAIRRAAALPGEQQDPGHIYTVNGR